MLDQNQRTKGIAKERTGNSSHFDAGKSLRDGAPSSEKELPEGEQNHCRLEGAASCSAGFRQAQRLVRGVSLISSPCCPASGLHNLLH